MVSKEELVKYCRDQIESYTIDLNHDTEIHNFQEASEDKGRIDAYIDVLEFLEGGEVKEVPVVLQEQSFTLYWRDGKREIVKGASVEDAVTHAGYGQGALSALDFYDYGEKVNYVWNKKERNWWPIFRNETI